MTPAAALAPAEFRQSASRHAFPLPRLERARGRARLAIANDGAGSRLHSLHQAGSSRVRLPRRVSAAPFEAVLLNTAGGMTGGDRFEISVSVGAAAEAVVASQAAERIYRRSEGVAEIATQIDVAAGGHLAWLPQETIVFNRSALRRSLVAEVDGGATLLAVEALVLGRAAMGEQLTDVLLADSWRVRRDGRLIYADSTRLDGDAVEAMRGGATGGGGRAFATLLLVAPNAEARVGDARDALAGLPGESGVSGFDGMLAARLLAPGGQALRGMVVRLVEALRGAPMPRVWNC